MENILHIVQDRGAYDFLWGWDYRLIREIEKMAKAGMTPQGIGNSVLVDEGRFIAKKAFRAARHITREKEQAQRSWIKEAIEGNQAKQKDEGKPSRQHGGVWNRQLKKQGEDNAHT